MIREIIIPGKPFAKSVEALRQEFIKVIATRTESFPLSRMFDYIQLTESNAHIQEKLIKRGELDRKSRTTFENKARRSFYERMVDLGPNLDGVQIYIPRKLTLKIEYKTTTDSILFSFEQISGGRILTEFDEPPAPGFGTNFVLKKLEGTKHKWTYFFENENDADIKVNLVVDLKAEAIVKAGRRSTFKKMSKAVLIPQRIDVNSKSAFPQCECKCCETIPGRRNCPPSTMNLTIEMRGIILLDTNTQAQPLRQRYQNWITNTQTMFNGTNIEIVNESVTEVVDPAMLILSADPCTSNARSQDFNRLYQRYYTEVRPGLIYAFLVQSLSGTTVGCAAHPAGRPGFVLEWNSTNHVFEHELGHVLNLQHVSSRDNLMFRSTGWSSIPPLITQGQIETMRCSGVPR